MFSYAFKERGKGENGGKEEVARDYREILSLGIQ